MEIRISSKQKNKINYRIISKQEKRNPMLNQTRNKVMLALTTLVLMLGLVAPGSVSAQSTSQQADTRLTSDFDYNSQTLRVGVWMQDKDNQDILQKGEKFTVGFQANQDAYAVVYHIETDGTVSVLWPRSRYDDGFVFGTHEYLLPVSGSRRLSAGHETGEGFVEAIVSSYPFDLRDLELDFHHENTDRPQNFQVAGDPFLAMNEVNYVITGLEDSGDYVVTNYLSYYVHQQVEHPRYLCNQCHFEDDVTYHPYRDDCTLEINYDYGWTNDWYDNYGYYPVYSNPVYVYVDPWTWRPWVNFWYDPWYTCAPSWGWGWGWDNCYSWHHSPHYWGGSHHDRRWSPLNRNHLASREAGRVKDREYGRVSGLVGRGAPTDRERVAMRDRTQISERKKIDRDTRRPGSSGRIRGEERVSRDRVRIDSGSSLQSNGGLRIRDNNQVRIGGESGRAPARHQAGGSNTKPSLKPVRRTERDLNNSGSRLQRPDRTTRTGADKPAENRLQRNKPNKPGSSRVRPENNRGTERNIKPVEPRRKGTRIWNTRPESNSRSGSSRQPTVKENRTRGSNQPTVRPRSNSRSSTNKPTVKSSPSRNRNSGSSASKPKSQPKVRSGGSKKNDTSAKSSGGSRSSGSKSSGSSRGGSSKRR